MLTESTAKRCPACHSKLRRRRGQPIVLGETSRLDLQASLLVDRQNRMRLEHGHWNAERPAPMPETFARAEAEPVAFVEPEPAPLPEAKAWFDEPAPELEPYPFFEPIDAEPKVEPVATRSFLALALAAHARKPIAPTRSDADAALDGDDVNSVVDALHRKARGAQIEVKVDVPPVQLFEDPELPSRSLRLMAPPSTNRRRWNIDFKSRRGDDI